MRYASISNWRKFMLVFSRSTIQINLAFAYKVITIQKIKTIWRFKDFKVLKIFVQYMVCILMTFFSSFFFFLEDDVRAMSMTMVHIYFFFNFNDEKFTFGQFKQLNPPHLDNFYNHLIQPNVKDLPKKNYLVLL